MKKSNPKTVLITGANGFIGKNLTVRLGEFDDINVIKFLRDDDIELLDQLLPEIDLIFHLAGENRPLNLDQFLIGNKDFTKIICDAMKRSSKQIPIIFTSSIQATLDNPYGKSKFEAEKLLEKMAQVSNIPTLIYRIPGVFGKWSRPNYNSVVATFCYNISRDIPIIVNDPDKNIELIYIDDLIDMLICDMQDSFTGFHYKEIKNTYDVNLQTLSETLHSFKNSRNSLISERVGSGFNRALYATYISNLPLDSFTYDVAMHGDERGVFVEMLKTKDSGQFSFFTAHPGIVRGEHYHHTKSEKFLVITGKAKFGFRNIVTGEMIEIITSGEKSTIVETIPGWAHNIKNIGDCEMVVMLWANEIFNQSKPDTIANEV